MKTVTFLILASFSLSILAITFDQVSTGLPTVAIHYKAAASYRLQQGRIREDFVNKSIQNLIRLQKERRLVVDKLNRLISVTSGISNFAKECPSATRSYQDCIQEGLHFLESTIEFGDYSGTDKRQLMDVQNLLIRKVRSLRESEFEPACQEQNVDIDAIEDIHKDPFAVLELYVAVMNAQAQTAEHAKKCGWKGPDSPELVATRERLGYAFFSGLIRKIAQKLCEEKQAILDGELYCSNLIVDRATLSSLKGMRP